jgi:hypothetical protein
MFKVKIFHPHPGLMLSLYEARAYHLIHETKIDKELAYVMAKVEAIDTEDDLYVPWDYADRVKKLITYVQTRYAVFSYVFFLLRMSFLNACSDALSLMQGAPPKTDVLNLFAALPQYIALYYPERYIFSITSHAFYKGDELCIS